MFAVSHVQTKDINKARSGSNRSMLSLTQRSHTTSGFMRYTPGNQGNQVVLKALNISAVGIAGHVHSNDDVKARVWTIRT